MSGHFCIEIGIPDKISFLETLEEKEKEKKEEKRRGPRGRNRKGHRR